MNDRFLFVAGPVLIGAFWALTKISRLFIIQVTRNKSEK
jgi:hypothetical protein